MSEVKKKKPVQRRRSTYKNVYGAGVMVEGEKLMPGQTVALYASEAKVYGKHLERVNGR